MHTQQRYRMSRVGVVVCAVSLIAAGTRADVNWTNGLGGNWEASANWSPNQVPTNQNVNINAAGDYAVIVGDGAAAAVPGSFTNAKMVVHSSGAGDPRIDFTYTAPITFRLTDSAGLDIGDATVEWNAPNATQSFNNLTMAYWNGTTNSVFNIRAGRVHAVRPLFSRQAWNTATMNIFTNGYFEFTSSDTRLGSAGKAVVNILGGTMNFRNSGCLGHGRGSTGVMVIASGHVTSPGTAGGLDVGSWASQSSRGGYGRVDMYDGLCDVRTICVASGPDGRGDFNLYGGQVNSSFLKIGYGLTYSTTIPRANATGTVVIAGGDWHAGGGADLGVSSNCLGTLIVSNGTFSVRTNSWNSTLDLGDGAHGTGELYIRGGRVDFNGNWSPSYGNQMVLGLADNSAGRFVMTAGRLDIRTGRTSIIVGSHDGASAEAAIAGGDAVLYAVSVGTAAGTKPCGFRHYGGTVTVDRAGNALLVEQNGTFTFKGGTLRDGGTSADLDIAGGTFEGYGVVGLQDAFRMDGRVIADGQATNGVAADRTLSLTNLTGTFASPVENAGGNGWFAINRGKLELPPVSVGAGSVSVNWGEDPADLTNDLVNSVRVSLTDASAGSLNGALLATDRGDVSLGALKGLVGVWEFTGPAFGTAALAFRYDDALVASLGLDEDNLGVFVWRNGGWTGVTAGRDTANKIVTTGLLDSFSRFAVGEAHRGTLVLIR